MASAPRVELLWWRECPSWERALDMLREAMADKGLDPDSIEVSEIDTEAAARRHEFVGSPTIRVNGVDVQPPVDGEPTGLACRVYRRRDGRTSPLPDPEDLREALGAAALRSRDSLRPMPTAIGERAPGFELPATDGERHALSAEGAAATVVYWTCNHCPYALAWHERLLDVARDYSDRGVRVLAISSNDSERYPADSFEAMVERVQQEGGWPHPYLYDETQQVAREWGAERTPHVFVLDSGLQLRYRGAPDADYDDPSQDAAWLRAALDAVLAGQEPDPSETEAEGCTIKWKP